MAMPKAGSRKIVVDKIPYRWRIRKRVTYWQAHHGSSLNLAVTLEEASNSILFLRIDGVLHPKICDRTNKDLIASVKPADVAKWIRDALKQGWDPAAKGQFTLSISHAPEAGSKAGK